MNPKTCAIVIALLALPVPAHAVDFSAPITLMDGSPMRKDDPKTGPILTLADVAETVLLGDYHDEAFSAPDNKLKRFRLAEKIEDHRKDPILTAEDIALIKHLVGKAYNPLVYGRTIQLIDPASLKEH